MLIFDFDLAWTMLRPPEQKMSTRLKGPMSLKTSDLGQILTVKILVKKFFGSDHSVALLEMQISQLWKKDEHLAFFWKKRFLSTSNSATEWSEPKNYLTKIFTVKNCSGSEVFKLIGPFYRLLIFCSGGLAIEHVEYKKYSC